MHKNPFLSYVGFLGNEKLSKSSKPLGVSVEAADLVGFGVGYQDVYSNFVMTQ